MTAGLAAGFAGVAAWLLLHYAAAHELDAFLFWGWRYNFSYIGSMPLPRQAARAFSRSVVMAVFWAPLVALVGQRRPRPMAPAAAVMAVWLGAMALAVTAGGRYFGNYYLMLLPPLAVLAGRLPVRRVAVGGAAALAAASIAAAFFWPALRPDLAREDARYRDAGRWIRERTAPADRLFVWGDSAQLYVYSDRLMATRFAFANYHTGKIWGTGADEAGATARPDLVVPRAWDELLHDFQQAPPDVIVDAAAGGLHGFGGHGIDRYPELESIVAAGYREIGAPAGIPVYRRLPATGR
jgi:hypothetical protein